MQVGAGAGLLHDGDVRAGMRGGGRVARVRENEVQHFFASLDRRRGGGYVDAQHARLARREAEGAWHLERAAERADDVQPVVGGHVAAVARQHEGAVRRARDDVRGALGDRELHLAVWAHVDDDRIAHERVVGRVGGAQLHGIAARRRRGRRAHAHQPHVAFARRERERHGAEHDGPVRGHVDARHQADGVARKVGEPDAGRDGGARLGAHRHGTRGADSRQRRVLRASHHRRRDERGEREDFAEARAARRHRQGEGLEDERVLRGGDGLVTGVGEDHGLVAAGGKLREGEALEQRRAGIEEAALLLRRARAARRSRRRAPPRRAGR